MFQILVHRGLSEYPENSSLALQKALENGFGIEIDIHRTKDSALVVTHDSDLKRLYNHDEKIAGLKLQQIKSISKSKNHEILTLMEAFELFRKYSKQGTFLAVQIKESTEERLAELTACEFEKFDKRYANFNIYKRAFVFDPTKKVAKHLKKMQPKIIVGISVGEKRIFEQKKYRNKYPTIYTSEDIESFPYFDIVWADEWRNGLYSREFVEKMHKTGKKVYAVSPELHKNTEPSHPHALNLEKIKKDWINLAKWGFDGICTDYPSELSKALNTKK